MESYYDSEEEIAWGPVTLREIKGDFKRPVIRLPERRHTISSNFQMASSSMNTPELPSKDIPDLCQEVARKLNVSEFSTDYYTPNASLRTESNSDFLEKLSKVVNEPQAELTTYTDALESTKTSVSTGVESKSGSFRSAQGSEHSNTAYLSLVENINNTEDSCLNFLKVAVDRTTNYDIANFQQSLVENSVLLSEDESESANESEYLDNEVRLHTDQKNENRHTLIQRNLSTTEDEDIIVISDNEESLISMDSIEDVAICKSFLVKKETNFEYEAIQENYNTGEIAGDDYTSSTDNDKISISSEESRDEDKNSSISHILATTEEQEPMRNSPITIPKIVPNEYDDSNSKNDSLQLNDTVEEMNRLLNEGWSYTMSDDSIIEETPKKESIPEMPLFRPSNIISSSFSQGQSENFLKSKEKRNRIPVRKPASSEQRQLNRFNTVATSPIASFKIPKTPSRTKFTPSSTPPKSSSNHLKHIVSPVALYIKNSPCMTLKQNVPQRELSKIVISKNSKSSSKENCPDFPEVVYKPSRKQITSTAKEIILPPSFKKLNIKEPSITKHEGRINLHINKTTVNRKLLENDITNNSIEDSMLSEISVLTNKHAYIK